MGLVSPPLSQFNREKGLVQEYEQEVIGQFNPGQYRPGECSDLLLEPGTRLVVTGNSYG